MPKSNSRSSVNSEMDVGISPSNMLERSDKNCNLDKFPISDGILPSRKLNPKSKYSKFERLLILPLKFPMSELP